MLVNYELLFSIHIFKKLKKTQYDKCSSCIYICTKKKSCWWIFKRMGFFLWKWGTSLSTSIEIVVTDERVFKLVAWIVFTRVLHSWTLVKLLQHCMSYSICMTHEESHAKKTCKLMSSDFLTIVWSFYQHLMLLWNFYRRCVHKP